MLNIPIDHRTPEQRLARFRLLRTLTPVCVYPDHIEDPRWSTQHDVLRWITQPVASDVGPWITRIGGDSANGYEYTCTECVIHDHRTR